MKMFSIAALGAVAVTGLAPVAIAAPADAAQRTVVHERTIVRHGGPRYRWNNRRVCHWERHRGHRERVCRVTRVRVRY